MTEKLVSVIIPSYNGELFIAEALESVASQTYPHWEVIVVEDASHDGAEDIVKSFRQKVVNHRVEFIRHGYNQGVSATRNTAIQAARGEWLAFLDHDDIWLPHHFEASLKELQDHSADLCFSGVASFTHPADVGKPYPTLDLKVDWKAQLFFKNQLVLSSVILKRAVMRTNTPFDISPDIQHCEDYDLWLRLVEQGANFVKASSVGVRYRTHGSQATAKRGMMLEREFNALLRHYATYPSPKASKRDRLAQLAQEAGFFYWTTSPSKAAYFLKKAFYYRPWRMKSGLLALKSALRTVSSKKSTKNLGVA